MKQRFARWLLARLGWRLEGSKPLLDQYVLIAAPHTSNWDFPMMLLFAAAFDIPVKWLGKHTLFRPPMGWIMRALGGVAIERSRKGNAVTALVETFAAEQQLVIVVPTEGTRRKVQFWKSGFYHIAREANVPIVPSFLDYGEKRGGFGPPLHPSGDPTQDMQYFRDFYAGMRGKFPDQFGPIKLKEEEGGK